MCPVRCVLPLVPTVRSRGRRRRSPARLKTLALNRGPGGGAGVSRASGRRSAAPGGSARRGRPRERSPAAGRAAAPGRGRQPRCGQPGAGPAGCGLGRADGEAGAIGARLPFCVRLPPSAQDPGALMCPLLGASGLLSHADGIGHREDHIGPYGGGKEGKANPVGRARSRRYSACIHTGPSAGAGALPVTARSCKISRVGKALPPFLFPSQILGGGGGGQR